MTRAKARRLIRDRLRGTFDPDVVIVRSRPHRWVISTVCAGLRPGRSLRARGEGRTIASATREFIKAVFREAAGQQVRI